jgi:serine/threonine protein kinase
MNFSLTKLNSLPSLPHLKYCLCVTRCDSGDGVKASVSFVCAQDGEAVLHWRTRLNVAHGTADGILYLHTAYEKPLVHRDVKSANVLLDQQLVPKV